MDSYNDDDYKDSKKYTGLRDYHLRSALISYNLRSSRCEKWERNLKSQLQALEECFPIINRDPVRIFGMIIDKCAPMRFYGEELEALSECLDIESRSYESMEVPLLKDASILLKERAFEFRYYLPSQFFQSSIVIANAMNAKKPLPDYVGQTQFDMQYGTVTKHSELLSLTLVIYSECFGIVLPDQKMSIHSIDHLRNWSDKFTERFNVEIASIFGHRLNPVIYPKVDFLYRFWGIWDNYLRVYGNEFFRVIKIFEAMVIGVLLRKNKNCVIKERSDFLESTTSDFLLGLEEKHEGMVTPLRAMENFLLQVESSQYLSQLYGLYRTWGHPVVNPLSGIQKVYDLGSAEKSISDIIPKQIRRVFLLKYAIWYKGAKGAYPDFSPIDRNNEENYVLKLLRENASTDALLNSFNSPFWDEIRVEKCVEIPKTYNLSEMVADKAISPDRSSLYALCEKGGNMYDANVRRGVLQWLSRVPESCEDFLKRVNDQSLTEDELIIGLYQKEREVNKTPRMFALMSHSIRNYIVTTEAMLSSDILPAFPNITMTDSLLSLQKKIYSVSHKQAQNETRKGFSVFRDVTIIVNIDFEKWNLNFRRETTFPLFEAIGDIYGLPMLYNRTYDVFESSLIYLAGGSTSLPINKDSRSFVLTPPLLYIGHKGGFEGLRQKGWTLFTDCALDLICSRHKCSYTIMGQGDNQVLALTWRTYELGIDRGVTEEGKVKLTKRFNGFMDDLVQTFSALGLPVKALETWTSENLFLYGKFPTLKGVPLAMSLKKICRAYYLANEEVMTLDCALATIQSNAMAACMSDVTSFVPYVVYKIQTFLALRAFSEYHVLIGKGAFSYQTGDSWRFTSSSGTKREYTISGKICQKDFFILLSWFPKILGGVSIATLYDFLMRGFPDRVSAHLTWINHLIKASPNGVLRQILRGIYQCHINPEKNFVLLIEDPCALNLIVPVDARASVRQSVQELFENMDCVRNQEFSSLFKFNSEWDKKEFCEELCRGEILHPRFLHDVAAATLGGYVDSVVSKVSKSSTINKIALHSSSKNPGKKMERAEENYMKYLLWKLYTKNSEVSHAEHECPTMQARDLRIKSWDKQLEGVTVPHPMAFLSFRNCTENLSHYKSCNKNYILVALPECFSTGDLDIIHTLGSSPPYLGSETKEKVGNDPTRQVFGKEPLISRPLRLLRVINWFVSPGTISESLIHILLKSVSDLNPAEYVSREMGVTGSEAHRYRDQALKHGVMSANMYTLGSHMHISTDPWIKYTRGAENFTINYQAILCSIQSWVGGHLFDCHYKKNIPPREYHFHESCKDCIEALTDEFHDITSYKVLELVPSAPNNPYLWVTEASLTLKYKNDPQLTLRIDEMSYNDYQSLTNKRGILTSWISEDIITDVLTSSSERKSPRLLDSRDYPRVMYKKLGVIELWEETALGLIARAGIKYTNKQNGRVAYPQTAKSLAADDIMKCSSSSLLGLSVFFSWPSKFLEIELTNKNFVFPDTNPPTASSCCTATQINMRKVIAEVEMRAAEELVISRMNRNPSSAIKAYWYRILCSEGTACPHCITEISELEINDDITSFSRLKCLLDHTVVTPRMMRIRILTASEDKLLKDSVPFELFPIQAHRTITIPECPAVVEFCTQSTMDFVEMSYVSLDTRPPKSKLWQYCIQLPTNSKCRTYEILSIIKSVSCRKDFSTGVIFGDGLGTTSCIISSYFPKTKWIAASLQDSERAIPQSYPHILISGNPFAQLTRNVDYMISKCQYNDILSDNFVSTWEKWVSGGMCWVEAEVKESRLKMVENVLNLSDWELVVFRTDFSDYLEGSLCVSAMKSHAEVVKLFVCGSLDIENLEVVIVLQNSTKERRFDCMIDSLTYGKNYLLACEQLHTIAEGLEYGHYLSSIETLSELTREYSRCDHWFAQVGMTHLFACTKLLTPIWWDLQTGKIPAAIKDLEGNKKYYLYLSDKVALQARLLSLAISCVSNREEYIFELNNYEYWDLKISKENDYLKYVLERSAVKTNYGPDQLLISKYVPLLRKLSHLYNRWWKFMPFSVTFHTNVKAPGFWISKLSQTLPNNLPSSI